MLGAPLETFKANKAAVAVVIVLGLFLGAIALSVFDTTAASFAPEIILIALLGSTVLTLVYLVSVRVSIHPDGISYHSLFTAKEMRWDEVERFYYSPPNRSIKLTDAGGQKILIRNLIQRREEVLEKLLSATSHPLLRKATVLFDSGAELDFGAIRVSKNGGLKIRKWFRSQQIPWEQVAGYRIEGGRFYVWPAGKKYVTGRCLSQIPNAFVLVDLLEAIDKVEPTSA